MQARSTPEGKYLDELDDDALPQVSDALLVMVQFETALAKFVTRHFNYVSAYGRHVWITEEVVVEMEQLPDEDDGELEEDEEPQDDQQS